jgi:hypothetical protein
LRVSPKPRRVAHSLIALFVMEENMFEDFETQLDISIRKFYSLGSIRKFSMDKKFPKAERVIGRTNFYDKKKVDQYFDAKVDRRFIENKRRN